MKKSTKKILDDFFERYPALSCCKNEINSSIEVLIYCYYNERKIMTCGNGGSAADAQHIVGELMKSFVLPRRLQNDKRKRLAETFPEQAELFNANLQDAIPAVSLVGELALSTAITNDITSAFGFAQSVYGFGKAGDVLIAISTSGNSENILYAAQVAKALDISVVALTGQSGGRLKAIADIAICVPSAVTHEIQEFHLPVYHVLCLAEENELFGGE